MDLTPELILISLLFTVALLILAVITYFLERKEKNIKRMLKILHAIFDND